MGRIFCDKRLWAKCLRDFSVLTGIQFQDMLHRISVNTIRKAAQHGHSPLFSLNAAVKDVEFKLNTWLNFCKTNEVPIDARANTQKYYHLNYQNTPMHEWLINEHFDTAERVLNAIKTYELSYDMSIVDANSRTPLHLGLIVGAPDSLIAQLTTIDSAFLGLEMQIDGQIEIQHLYPVQLAYVMGRKYVLQHLFSYHPNIDSLCQLANQENLCHDISLTLLKESAMDPERGSHAKINLLLLEGFFFYVIPNKNSGAKLVIKDTTADVKYEAPVSRALMQKMDFVHDNELSDKYPCYRFLRNHVRNIDCVLEVLQDYLMSRNCIAFSAAPLSYATSMLFSQARLRQNEITLHEVVSRNRAALLDTIHDCVTSPNLSI